MLTLMLALVSVQEADLPPPLERDNRPSVQCAEHLTDSGARNRCLDGLLDAAEAGLDAALAAAREEAREIDLDMPGAADAVTSLEAAHSAWIAYRDAECTRRASLLLLGDHGDDERLDCLVTLTRARAAELTDY
ncbi:MULTISPECIES: lysozyme inhibitor LprI family protein [Hyphobacterium]|uniref:Lysozyme inhibitor LprI family protein n=1 Tax=Hyphobacterium vulgare TaxID=1736751 RepID=A0ABV6ZZM0_9PROT